MALLARRLDNLDAESLLSYPSSLAGQTGLPTPAMALCAG
jgi:hypothetical protein